MRTQGISARVVEPVDTRDLKSLGLSRAGSTPAPGTTISTRAFILRGRGETDHRIAIVPVEFLRDP
jgi:hypothetical protein